MSGITKEAAVRPLGHETRHGRPPGPVGVVSVAMLLFGAAIGFLIGLPAGVASQSAESTAPPVDAATVSPPVVSYDWTTQEPTPTDPSRWAVVTAIEHDGFIYLLALNDFQNRRSRTIWRSVDGLEWDAIAFESGPDAVITDLDSYGDSLLASGWEGTTATIWRSDSLESAATARWTAIPLQYEPFPAARLIEFDSTLNTVVNIAGEVVVVADMQFSLDDTLVDLSSNDQVSKVLHFDEMPVVALTQEELWMRIVEPGGVESVHAFPVPTTIATHPTSGRWGMEVPTLRAWAMWTSSDGTAFSAALPPSGGDGVPSVMAFGEGFAASRPIDGGRFTLLASADGTDWSTALGDGAPGECGNDRPAAAGAGVILLTSRTFDRTCTTTDGVTWEIHASPETRVSNNTLIGIAGGPNGFLARVLRGSNYGVLESADGVNWAAVEYGADMAGGNAVMAGDNIVVVARYGGRWGTRPWTLWVGRRATD